MSVAEIGAIVDPTFLAPTWTTSIQTSAPESFEQIFMGGLNRVNNQVNAADTIATRFALDDRVPPHQVLVSMEQAHLSLALMLQVRARLVQGYQQIMQMQL